VPPAAHEDDADDAHDDDRGEDQQAAPGEEQVHGAVEPRGRDAEEPLAVQAEHVVPGLPGEGDGVAVGELERTAERPGVERQHRSGADHGAGGVGGGTLDAGARADATRFILAPGERVDEENDPDQAGLELEGDGESGEQSGGEDGPAPRGAVPLLHQDAERGEGEGRGDHV
jgi:hypothetical protein